MTPFLFLVRIAIGLFVFAVFCAGLAALQWAIETGAFRRLRLRLWSWSLLRYRARLFWWLRSKGYSLSAAWTMSGLR